MAVNKQKIVPHVVRQRSKRSGKLLLCLSRFKHREQYVDTILLGRAAYEDCSRLKQGE